MKIYLSLFLLKVPKLQMAEENGKGSRDPSILNLDFTSKVVQKCIKFCSAASQIITGV